MDPNRLTAQHLPAIAAAALPLAAWGAHAAVMRRRLEQARRDPLTELVTRDGFTARAEQLLRHRNAVVLFIDLDHFKHVNDTHGHAAGDAVLQATAAYLARWVGPRGIAGRLGGDEFTAALTLRPERFVPRVNALSAALHQPLDFEGERLPRGASIGIARSAELPERTLTAALAAADTAMYAAKRQRSGLRVYTTADLGDPRRWNRTGHAA